MTRPAMPSVVSRMPIVEPKALLLQAFFNRLAGRKAWGYRFLWGCNWGQAGLIIGIVKRGMSYLLRC